MSILIKNASYVVTQNNKREVLKNQDILIKGCRIAKINQNLSQGDEVIDAKDKIVMPGLINAHSHAAMTLFRGVSDDIPLMEWLQKHIWPMESQLKPLDVYIGTKLACAEMIRSGVTTFNDMYHYMIQAAQAVEEAGMRGYLCQVVLKPGLFNQETASVFAGRKLFRLKNKLITPVLGPHSVYGCTESQLNNIRELCNEYSTIIHIHACETKQEVINCKKQTGLTPIAYLDKLGLLTAKTIIAHCIWPTAEEIKLIKKRGAKVVHCPVSNMKLASGVAPLHKYLQAKINTALGSDGPCSNNNFDLLEELKFAALLHKNHNLNPALISAQEALDMATINGARVLGLNAGSIESGKLADIILLNLKKPHLTPIHSIISNLVYSANGNDVDTVIIDGKIIMKNKEILTFDESKIIKKAGEVARYLLERAGLSKSA